VTADQRLQKALLLLDRGDVLRGEEELRGASAAADKEQDGRTSTVARCALGALLVELGRSTEAAVVLEAAIRVAATTEGVGSYAKEARDRLKHIRNGGEPVD
jgi:hypothetical protein